VAQAHQDGGRGYQGTGGVDGRGQVVVQRLGAGTSPDVTIDSLVLYRIGAELGA